MNPKYRNRLPQLNGKQCICDGGIETHLVFNEGFDLPLFAAFPLVGDPVGRAAIDRYMRGFANIALRDGKGFILDTPTWRASARWANDIEVSIEFVRQCHIDAVQSLFRLRAELETPEAPFIINGAVGPQDDGYNPKNFMSSREAETYHAEQIGWFSDLGTDMVSAVTMTYAGEAIGIANACAKADMPSVISFTVETDGNLPSAQPIGDAIAEVDSETRSAPAYYMINCAHPDHFDSVIRERPAWLSRVMGIRANASRMSHAELDVAEELDFGDPLELAQQYLRLAEILPNLTVMGGCCGTDHRHIDTISKVCSN